MTNTKTLETWTVIWRQGGPARFRWHRTLALTTQQDAVELAREVERKGYRALVHRTAQLDRIGLPETWDA